MIVLKKRSVKPPLEVKIKELSKLRYYFFKNRVPKFIIPKVIIFAYFFK